MRTPPAGRRGPPLLGLWTGLVLSLGCLRPSASAGSPEGSAGRAGARLRPDFAGWVLAPEGPAGSGAATAPDGSRRFIFRGTRWIDRPDGRTERSRQVFEEEDVEALELPPHLGGGFLFYAASGRGTLLWRADSWTGDVRALGRVDPPVRDIVAGFDRLYLGSTTSAALRAIDADGGQPLDLAPLPPAPAYGPMLFADAWMAVVVTSVRGALATFDAGESWHPLRVPAPVTALERLATGGVRVTTERGRHELSPAGRWREAGTRGDEGAFRGLDAGATYAPEAFERPDAAGLDAVGPGPLPLGRRPLRAAVLRGWPDTPSSAVVVEQGAYGRVRLVDGEALWAKPFGGVEPCRGVALGAGFGFVCADAGDRTEVYSFQDDALELELRLDAPRAVRSSGNGALVIAAGCDAVTPGADPLGQVPVTPRSPEAPGVRRYCARQPSGRLFDVRVRGDIGTERVAALRDGRVAVLIPPRSNSSGRLTLLSEAGGTTVELELDPNAGPSARLVRSGLWLDDLWELENGELGAWVVGARAFVGVRVDLAGKVRIARLQEGADEVLFHGSDALHVAGAASLRETTDQGFEWRVSALPPEVLAPVARGRERWPLRGCSPVGCVYDDWLRVGFSGEAGVPEPVRAPEPERVVFEASRFAFWTLGCDVLPARSTGVAASSSAARGTPAPSPQRGHDAPESSAWLSLMGAPPPERRAGDVGYDFGAVNEGGAFRAYVWGPPGASWPQRALWQVSLAERFSSEPPSATSASKSPWSDAAAAAQAFGLDASTGVDWWYKPAASERFGVLQLRVRSESSLHLLERDRSIISLDLSKLPELGVIAGAHVVGDRWYLGASRSEQFHLYRVEGDEPRLVGSYPLLGRVSTQLVGSVHGDELGIWARSPGGGWQVFPLDLDSHQARPPLHVPAERLGRVPPRCEPGRPGWHLVAGVPLTETSVSESNTHLDFNGVEPLRTKRLTARLVLDEAGVCVESLSALVDGGSPREVRPPPRERRRGALPLTVTDALDERRWDFLCSPSR